MHCLLLSSQTACIYVDLISKWEAISSLTEDLEVVTQLQLGIEKSGFSCNIFLRSVVETSEEVNPLFVILALKSVLLSLERMIMASLLFMLMLCVVKCSVCVRFRVLLMEKLVMAGAPGANLQPSTQEDTPGLRPAAHLVMAARANSA